MASSSLLGPTGALALGGARSLVNAAVVLPALSRFPSAWTMTTAKARRVTSAHRAGFNLRCLGGRKMSQFLWTVRPRSDSLPQVP